MKLNIVSKDNQNKGTTEMPSQFSETIRPDLIKRAVLALHSANRQPYGADPEAGNKYSVRISKRRHDYRGTYGIGQSRTPRKVMSYRGSRFNWTGAFAPQTVGGRRAHPPKALKNWLQKINKKEKSKAMCSALAATLNRELVTEHGYKVPDNYPFIIDESFEKIVKTAEVKKTLNALGFSDDLTRAEEKKVRAGKGKMRGRKYKTKTSVLFVVADSCPLINAADNIPGVDVATLAELNAEHLAPGAQAGRATLYTTTAIQAIKDNKMYLNVKKAKKSTEKKGKEAKA